MVMEAINKAIELAKNPTGFMTSDKDAPASVNGIIMNYAAILAVIPFFAILLGDLWYNVAFYHYEGGRIVAAAFVHALLIAILYVVAVYIIGYVIQELAPSFGTAKDQVKSMKLSAYVFTPVFLISALSIIPPLGILGFIGALYGLYIFYIGLPIVLGTAKDRVVPYLVVTLVVALVVLAVIFAIVGIISAVVLGAAVGFM